MSQERRELTKDNAVKILSSYKQTNAVDTPYKGIEISNISYTDKDGNPFTWDDGSEYGIVNLKAQNAYGRQQAIEHLQEGNLQEACNTNLSISVNVPEVNSLAKGMLGTLILGEVTLKDGSTAVLPRKFSAMEAVKAETFDFSALVEATEEVGAEA